MASSERSVIPSLGDWDDIRFVLALSRSRSLKDAANRLGVNQSTVYRRVNRCEAELSVRLFERSPQGHRLTPAGEQLVEFAAETESRLADLTTQLQGRDLRLTGSLYVTTTDIMARTLLLPALSGFRKSYPGIQVHLSIDSHRYDLTRREADIAFRPTSNPPGHLSGVCLRQGQWCVYAGGGIEVPRDIAGLGHADCVTGDQELANVPGMQWFMEHIDPDRVLVRSSSVAACVETVIREGGICLLPDYIGDEIPALKRAPIESGHSMDIWLLTHPEIRKAARIRAFFDYFVDRFQVYANDKNLNHCGDTQNTGSGSAP